MRIEPTTVVSIEYEFLDISTGTGKDRFFILTVHKKNIDFLKSNYSL